jgi:site-specific DNA-methyltransferase (adenine-specific)
MNLVTRKLTDLIGYEANARHNQEAIPKVKLSIERYGYKVPIVIDRDNVIVAGHTRFAALRLINKETGQYEEIQCILADDLDEDQIREFRIVDNQVAGIATWDFTTLKIELETLSNFNIEDFGEIRGFQELEIAEEIIKNDIKTDSDQIKIKIGPESIEISEAAYHAWAHYIVNRYALSVIEFAERVLQIRQEDRDYEDTPDM